jgi:hypothetical protein
MTPDDWQKLGQMPPEERARYLRAHRRGAVAGCLAVIALFAAIIIGIASCAGWMASHSCDTQGSQPYGQSQGC